MLQIDHQFDLCSHLVMTPQETNKGINREKQVYFLIEIEWDSIILEANFFPQLLFLVSKAESGVFPFFNLILYLPANIQ